MMPVEVRAQLTDALRLDLVGPGEVLGADSHVLGDANGLGPLMRRAVSAAAQRSRDMGRR